MVVCVLAIIVIRSIQMEKNKREAIKYRKSELNTQKFSFFHLPFFIRVKFTEKINSKKNITMNESGKKNKRRRETKTE